MAEEKLDCRGLACPNPVLRAKEIIERGDVEMLSVLVDNLAAKENVGRFLSRMGYEVSFAEQEGLFEVQGARKKSTNAFEAEAGGQCVLSGRWSLWEGRGEKQVKDQVFSMSTPVGEPGDARVVAAMTRLVDQLAGRIALALTTGAR